MFLCIRSMCSAVRAVLVSRLPLVQASKAKAEGSFISRKGWPLPVSAFFRTCETIQRLKFLLRVWKVKIMDGSHSLTCASIEILLLRDCPFTLQLLLFRTFVVWFLFINCSLPVRLHLFLWNSKSFWVFLFFFSKTVRLAKIFLFEFLFSFSSVFVRVADCVGRKKFNSYTN